MKPGKRQPLSGSRSQVRQRLPGWRGSCAAEWRTRADWQGGRAAL